MAEKLRQDTDEYYGLLHRTTSAVINKKITVRKEISVRNLAI